MSQNDQGQICQERMDAAYGRANDLFDEIFTECAHDEEDVPAIAYVLWIQLTHFLVFCGTPPARLVTDCVWHSEEQTSAGHA